MSPRELRRRLPAALALLAALALTLSGAAAWADGVLRARGPDGAERGLFPLVHTAMRAEVSGRVASVTVDQRFHNSFRERIEAVYVFPLPDDAAVDAMEMRVGRRVIRARVERRGEARRQYEAARARGASAAILEQERPNIFTFRVANVAPGGELGVSVHFFATAGYADGTYELALPMVVGPRYIPGSPLPGGPSGEGASPDTDRVPDASRISPPYAPPGTRPGHAVSVSVKLTPGADLERVEAPLHDVVVARESAAEATVTLRDRDEIPNRDFVLRWRVRAPALVASVLAHRRDPARDGYFSLTLEPRHDAPDDEVAPREVVFLLDTSGSMSGAPLDAVKGAVRAALSSLSPRDTFQVIDFADSASSFAPAAVPATPANLARAAAHLAALPAGGGTNQLAGIHAALSPPGDPGRLRYVVFMTDGYIGNEGEVIALTRRELGRARVFSFGVGASVNRYLLDEVAVAGRGAAEYLLPGEAPEAAIGRFYRRVARPYLTDVAVTFEGVDARSLTPRELPDVSALSPLTVYGRYRAGGSGRAVVTGRLAGAPFRREVAVTFPDAEPAHEAVAQLWARETIASLGREMHHRGESAERVEEITGLALTHRLVSAYTSLVAIDTESPEVASGGPIRQVVQPAAAPAGINLHAAGGSVVTSPAAPPAPAAAPPAASVDDLLHRVGGAGAVPEPAELSAASAPAADSLGLPWRPTRAAMQRVMLRADPLVQRCHARRPRAASSGGILSLTVSFDPSGAVAQVAVAPSSTAPRDEELERCVLAAVRGLRGEPFSGPVFSITLPFTLRPPAPIAACDFRRRRA